MLHLLLNPPAYLTSKSENYRVGGLMGALSPIREQEGKTPCRVIQFIY